MKRLYLYSKRDSVLKHWKSGMSRLYKLQGFQELGSLYAALEEARPAAVLFDYDGHIGEIEELLQYLKSTKTAVMAMNSSPVYSDGIVLLKGGARALLNAYASANNINQAVKAVVGGNIWLYPEFIQMMIRQNSMIAAGRQETLEPLSARERELAEMVALGMSNKEIAQTADIAEQTVKTHLKTVYEKLGVASRLELAIMVNSGK
ncbi:response regulator transcription factor [Sulfurimonas sp. HSL1-2]|uniref:response regulator transcription factor n=1 Tax=Thiomicrolovo zhangzhouensis TaxID=3131933 RepID=UPI0031F7CE64